MARLFVYGTLEIEAVLQAVTGRRFPGQSARLDGYARYLLNGTPYPGIVASRGACTPGTLYRGVDAETLVRLDRYEDRVYARREVRVTTDDGCLDAYAYVIPVAHRGALSSRPWNRREFERMHLRRFLGRMD